MFTYLMSYEIFSKPIRKRLIVLLLACFCMTLAFIVSWLAFFRSGPWTGSNATESQALQHSLKFPEEMSHQQYKSQIKEINETIYIDRGSNVEETSHQQYKSQVKKLDETLDVGRSKNVTDNDEQFGLTERELHREIWAPQPTVPGYKIMWDKPGLCSELDNTTATTRQEYLDLFVLVYTDPNRVYLHPALPISVANAITGILPTVEQRTIMLTGLSMSPPDIYVHNDARSLRISSCINNDNTVSYYDGAIHVSGDFLNDGSEIHASLFHEYIHHTLTSNGVRYPTWLQEGLAMYTANERWWIRSDTLALVSNNSFSLAQMTWVFPHNANEEFAIIAYAESILMVHFLIALKGEIRLKELIVALENGIVSPEESFIWACDLPEAKLVHTWREYLQAIAEKFGV